MELARLIGRTPGAVAIKACIFASLDPHQQARSIKAPAKVNHADREPWESFAHNSEAIAHESEAAFTALLATKPQVYVLELETPGGPTETETTVRARRVQSFFRAAVLASHEYDSPHFSWETTNLISSKWPLWRMLHQLLTRLTHEANSCLTSKRQKFDLRLRT